MLGHTAISQGLALFFSLGPAAFASIYLVERRGKRERVHPQRHVDISSLLESIPEAALIIDAEFHIIDANSNAAQILGMTRDELLHADVRQLRRLLSNEGGNGAGPAAILTRALKGESVRHERRSIQREGQEAVELLVSATPMRNERGDVISALFIARDMTELHALQRRMGDVERHLAIGQMAASLAHDFNNILAAIEQAIFILQTNPDQDKERRSVIAIIQNSVRRGSEIINRVRDYLRTGSGALGPVDLREIMSDSVELTRPLWTKAHIRMTCDLHPVGTVRANAADMRRVFTNLIINATEAMQDAGGNIVVSCAERDGHVVVTVRDTGKGIPPEVRKKIFYPYFTTKLKGTGLGLSGAQKIVLAQGGNISFRSEVGRGTTFIVTMPKADGDRRRGEQQPNKAA